MSPFHSSVIIDPIGYDLLRINFNITVMDLPCEFATIDVVDVLGTRTDNVTKNVNRWQLDANGVRRSYEGRNREQPDLQHDIHAAELEEFHRNGVHVIPLSENNFDAWLSAHEYTFVEFFAPWCIWCQRLAPVWELLAESQEQKGSAVSVVSVDCVENPAICMHFKVQAFPMMQLFKFQDKLGADYRADRTLVAFEDFISQQIALDQHVNSLPDNEKKAHLEMVAGQQNKHPGCLLVGFLLVNRVPGNFHIEARSKHHNLNPVMSNLSHIVNHLSFGPVFTLRELERMDYVPNTLFSYTSTHPMDHHAYVNTKLHQVYHHHIKVVTTVINDRNPRYDEGAIVAYQMVQASQIMEYIEEDVPEARFSFDISPMAVRIAKEPRPLYQFVTSVCAIIGGSFTVFGLFNGILSVLFKPKKM